MVILCSSVLMSSNKRYLVACSAGPDSMALLDMLVKMQEKMHFKVLVAHFDHQLRNDSQQETEVLQNYSVVSVANKDKNGLSVRVSRKSPELVKKFTCILI